MTRRSSQLFLPLCVSLVLAAGPAFAAFKAARVGPDAAPMVLDGVLDEAIWQSAPAHDSFYQFAPQDKVAAKVRTEVRVAFDQRYLYIGVKAFDPEPGQIRAPFTRRDKISSDQDFVGLYLDPAGAHKSAQMIYLNPRGAFSDGVFSDTNGEDTSPDFDFDVATARFDGGWSAELRIPFASIAYQAGQAAPWNLMMLRSMTRDTRYLMYSGQVTRATSCSLCLSEPIEGLRDLPTGLNWSATPQLVLHHGHEDVAGSPRRNFSSQDLSLDVKLRPNSGTVIDATLNPDFSQIELDAPQLSGNTRFGLFVQEKRPFFLEGSDIFQSPFRAIYTRSMASPSWGARYTRRDADSDLTVLTVHDHGGGLVLLPKSFNTDYADQDFSSQATVARANFKLGSLSAGALLSDRSVEGGRGFNRVLGPDFLWQRSDGERVRGQLLLSATTAQPDGKGSLVHGAQTNGHAALLDWNREEDSWGAYLGYEEASDGFRDDNGFFSQVGYRDYTTEFNRKFGKAGILDRWNVYAHLERKFDRQGNVIFDDYTPGVAMNGPYSTQLNIRVRPRNRTRVDANGPLFQTATVWAALSAQPGRTLAQVSVEGELGDEIDVLGARLGKGGYLSTNARLRPFDFLEFQPLYSVSWIDGKSGVEAGRRLYTEQALQLNGIYHFGARDTLRMILQKSLTRRDPSLYAQAVTARSSSDTTSFVYGHPAGLGTAAYVGLTLQKGEAPGTSPLRRQNELFVKLSWQI
ncbi:MAG: DUF5916 domain-containing protein [Pseudomonadota bacterium]